MNDVSSCRSAKLCGPSSANEDVRIAFSLDRCGAERGSDCEIDVEPTMPTSILADPDADIARDWRVTVSRKRTAVGIAGALGVRTEPGGRTSVRK